jgi:predicted nucleic acid-binding protein
VNGIADTGFLVAFANANDKHHKWAAQLATGVTEPLLTCEAVIAETEHDEAALITQNSRIDDSGTGYTQ